MKYSIIILLFLLFSCSHKIIGKNCEQVGESEYHVCDSLNGMGK